VNGADNRPKNTMAAKPGVNAGPDTAVGGKGRKRPSSLLANLNKAKANPLFAVSE
jgi:hypothetical protein